MILFLIGLILFILPQLIIFLVYKKYHPEESGNIKEKNIEIIKYVILNKNTLLLLLAFCLPIIWNFFPIETLKLRWVNFFQHAIGGGVAVGLSAVYIMNHLRNIRDLNPNFNIFKSTLFQFIFIYIIVSAFGCANEILEFTLDALRVGTFSADRYDTWYDIVANTTGGIFVFILYRIYYLGFNIFKSLF